MNIGEILQNFLDSNEPSITGKEHVLITISESYGTDLFKYDSLKEAREGNERIKTRSAELEDEEDRYYIILNQDQKVVDTEVQLLSLSAFM